LGSAAAASPRAKVPLISTVIIKINFVIGQAIAIAKSFLTVNKGNSGISLHSIRAHNALAN
jgi:hypothetical protein